MFPEQPCGFHSLIFQGTAHRLTPTSPDSGLESLPRETKEYIKHSKILNANLFLLAQNVSLQGWNSQNACQNSKTGKTVIRKKQSDLSLHCLSRSFLQATKLQL